MKALVLASSLKNVLTHTNIKFDIAMTGEKGIKEGSWDSIHVIRVSLE